MSGVPASPSVDISMTQEREAAQQAVRDLRERIKRLDDDGLDLVFRQARSHYGWKDRAVSQQLLHELYETIKFMPTAGNGNPARIVFVRSGAAKEKLLGCVKPGNIAKIAAAPVTAIIAYDVEFWRKLEALHPHRDNAGPFRNDPAKAERDAFRNGTLQGGYFMLAARALGLDVGPMSGFFNEKVDAQFFEGTSIRSNFLCNIGYADETAIFQRLPRLDFESVCSIL